MRSGGSTCFFVEKGRKKEKTIHDKAAGLGYFSYMYM